MKHEYDETTPMNRPTWLTGLWLANDCQFDFHWKGVARTAWRLSRTSKEVTELGWKRHDAARHLLAQELEGEIIELAPNVEAGLFSDLLSHVLSEIDWRRIAEEYLQDLYDELDPVEEIQCARGDFEP